MIREEEGDLTQEMRMLVLAKADELVQKYVQKIEDAKPPVTDEWTDVEIRVLHSAITKQETSGLPQSESIG